MCTASCSHLRVLVFGVPSVVQGFGRYAKREFFHSGAPYKVFFSPPLPSDMESNFKILLSSSKSMKFPFISQIISAGTSKLPLSGL